jgi:WD40 repeat protein
MKRVPRRLALLLVVLSLLQGATPAISFAQTSELTSRGTTYNYAQVATWIDVNRFAVARWDGTISIFRPPRSFAEFGPVLTQVLMLPSAKPAEMAAAISARTFVTSNDNGSLAVWTKNLQYALAGTIRYDPKYGIANSAAPVHSSGRQWLITGHSEGYIIIWKVAGSKLSMVRAVSMRSPNPIPTGLRLWNVRSVVTWKNGIVVTGSEDGDICLVSVPRGEILTRTRYNTSAQRGINSLSICGDYLTLANCSVGQSDKNLWLYKLSGNMVSALDSVNLIKDTSLPQVFNFSVQLAAQGESVYYFASTQEGLLWMGHIVNDKLVTLTSTRISCEGGAAIALQSRPWLLAAATFQISLFTLPSDFK